MEFPRPDNIEGRIPSPRVMLVDESQPLLQPLQSRRLLGKGGSRPGRLARRGVHGKDKGDEDQDRTAPHYALL